MSVYDELTELDRQSDIGTTFRITLDDTGTPTAAIEQFSELFVESPTRYRDDNGALQWYEIPPGVDILHEFADNESFGEARYWEYWLDEYVTELSGLHFIDVECQPVQWMPESDEEDEDTEIDGWVQEGWILAIRTGEFASTTPGDCATGVLCGICTDHNANGHSQAYEDMSDTERAEYDSTTDKNMVGWGNVSLGHFHGDHDCSHSPYVCPDPDCDCERKDFSDTRCSLCETTVAGERHDCVFWPIGWTAKNHPVLPGTVTPLNSSL